MGAGHFACQGHFFFSFNRYMLYIFRENKSQLSDPLDRVITAHAVYRIYTSIYFRLTIRPLKEKDNLGQRFKLEIYTHVRICSKVKGFALVACTFLRYDTAVKCA